MKDLKFGVLGAGFIGRVHMDIVKECERATVLGVCDPFAELAEKAMAKHFIECAKAGKQTIAPVYSGMVNNIVLDAIYESAKTGKSVDIDWSLLS